MGFFGGKKNGGIVTRRGFTLGSRRGLAPHKILAKRGRPGQRKKKRGEEGDGHGNGECAEKTPGHTGDGDQRQKNNDRRDGRADQRNGHFFQRALNCFEAALARVAVQDDVFEHDDRIIDNQTDGGSQTAESHQIEALTREFQDDEGDEQGGGNHEAGNERCAPVTQKEYEDDGREDQTEQYRVTHAGDGFVNDGRLIVEGFDVYARGQSRANLLDLGVNFVGDVKGVAVRLAMHAEQDGGFAVGGDHGVDGSDGRRNLGNIAETNGNARCRGLHHNLADLLWRSNLAADEAEDQLMIVLDQAGGVDEVRAANGVENVVDGDAGREEARRFGRYLEFRDAATLNENGGNAIEPVYARLEVVSGDFPELILRNRVGGQAIAKDWERGKGEAVRFDLGGRRQF